jgi:hypothetical protein
LETAGVTPSKVDVDDLLMTNSDMHLSIFSDLMTRIEPAPSAARSTPTSGSLAIVPNAEPDEYASLWTRKCTCPFEDHLMTAVHRPDVGFVAVDLLKLLQRYRLAPPQHGTQQSVRGCAQSRRRY